MSMLSTFLRRVFGSQSYSALKVLVIASATTIIAERVHPWMESRLVKAGIPADAAAPLADEITAQVLEALAGS